MKQTGHSLKRCLALLLSFVLAMSNVHVAAYAEVATSVPDGVVNTVQGEELSGTEESVPGKTQGEEPAGTEEVTPDTPQGTTPSSSGNVTPDNPQEKAPSGTEEAAPANPEPAAPVTAAFDQSKTVSGVTVSVKADPGVFPAGAELFVETVAVHQLEQADAAVDEVRDE